MIIVDALGALEDPNDPNVPLGNGAIEPRASRRAFSNARASGLTAVNMTIGHVLGDKDPFDLTMREIAQWDVIVRENAQDLLKVFRTADIERAKVEQKIGVIYGFQNTEMFGDQLERVDLFADLGVRVVQLTYNGPNAVGSGCLVTDDDGLTPFGRQIVERLNAKGVIVDLSHGGRRTLADAAHASRQPIAITHTGCHALNEHPRNTTDEGLRLVASRGGFVGIYFMPFLTSDRNATGDDVIRHLEHAIEICGEDHVGIGTDGTQTPLDDVAAYQCGFEKYIAERRAIGVSAPGERADILPFAVDLQGPRQFSELASRLDRRGHSTNRIEKVMGENFMRYAREVWGS